MSRRRVDRRLNPLPNAMSASEEEDELLPQVKNPFFFFEWDLCRLSDGAEKKVPYPVPPDWPWDLEISTNEVFGEWRLPERRRLAESDALLSLRCLLFLGDWLLRPDFETDEATAPPTAAPIAASASPLWRCLELDLDRDFDPCRFLSYVTILPWESFL